MKIKRGSTSVRRLIFVADSSSTTGAGLANLVYNTASLVAYYFAGDLSNDVQITLATATLGTYTSGGFVAVDNTNMPGWYEIGIPNAVLDGGNEVAIQLRGAANMVPVNVYIELDSFDYQTATQPVNVTQFGGTNGTFAAGIPTAALDSAAILAVADQVWDEAMSGHTTAGTYGGRIVRATNSNNEVQITGSNHIAADVHDFQTGVITAGDFAANSITASALATDAVTEIQSGLATSAALATESGKITAIETFATRMTTGLVADGQVYQFTANMLELGPAGGAATVAVLPATGIVADRSAGTTLNPVVGETISQSITVYQSDGTTAVSLSGKTLKVIFETMSGVDVAVVLAADITISGASSNVVTFAYPAAVTASERTLRFAIRDAAAPLTMYLQGVCSVVAAPKVDA